MWMMLLHLHVNLNANDDNEILSSNYSKEVRRNGGPSITYPY